jgi:hypothetical protein
VQGGEGCGVERLGHGAVSSLGPRTMS